MNSERRGRAVSCYRQLLQLRVLRSGLLQYGDVRIGVFPERKEVLVSSPGFGCIARYRVCAGEAEMRQHAHRFIDYNTAMGTQLVVTMAERAGVNAATLRAILAGNEATMSADAALGYRFARTVLSREVVLGDRLREEIVSRWGQKAVISLAFAVASARVFPTVKYALGHGKACVRVRVAGADALLQRKETSR